MSNHHKHSRREFLGRVSMGCASLGVTSLFSGITNLGLMNAAAAANRPLFESGNAAFVSNVGALIEPTTLAMLQNQTANIPIGLFSHLDQRTHWQTSVPQDINSLGWGGKLADILYTNNSNQDISMNISLDGVNVFQRGNVVKEYAINRTTGSVLLNGSSNNGFYQSLKRQTLDNLLDQTYNNVLETAYSNTISDSNGNSFGFSSAIANGTTITTPFDSESKLSQKLLMVAKTIAAREALGVKNQTFFIEHGGWDTHDGLLEDHAALLAEVDSAIGSFNAAMAEIGVEENVVGFTMSDFGRKLSSNGNGADHAWGGNALVFGNPVNGQKIYGIYPELYLENPIDMGGGRLIPTTSCDEYFAELALWFGASSADLDQIFPNINNFWIPTPDGGPLGFLG